MLAPNSSSVSLLSALEASIRAQVLSEQPKHQATGNRLMTAKQAGEYIARSESAVRQMVFRQQIPVVRIGRNVRIDRRDLDLLIEESKM